MGAIVIVGSLIYDQWSYFVVFLVINLFTQWEFYKLVKLRHHAPQRALGIIVGTFMFTISFLIEMGLLADRYYYVIFPLASLGFLFKLYKKQDKTPFMNVGFYYLGLLYVALPFTLLNIVVFDSGTYDFRVAIGLLLIIWASDTGAYFAGTMFGKTKLFERISPKKSWEGSLGGLLLAIVFALILAKYFDILPLWEWISIAVIVVIVGTYGDLVESLFKRTMKIKDSGKTIPGHGGFLDRFDSLILSIPFIVVFLKLF
ncbi:MAG: phosphatidate cytidylyltransferase [Cyclobacteriaceae bacterium]|nr:phosphatidate cytidylyltransferase [Cyclobacteriaceae bacterium HetDA_MAG_MS6]